MRVFHIISIFDKFKKIFMYNGKNFVLLNLFNFVLIYLKTLFQLFNYFLIKVSSFLNIRYFFINKVSNKKLILLFNFCTNSFFYFNLILETIRPVVLLSSKVFRGDIKKIPAFFNIKDRSYSKTFRWFRDKMRTNTTIYFFFFERFFKEFFSLFVNNSNLNSLKLAIYADFEKGRSFLKFVTQKNSTINKQDLYQLRHHRTVLKKKKMLSEIKNNFKGLDKKIPKKPWYLFFISKKNSYFFNSYFFSLYNRYFFDIYTFLIKKYKYQKNINNLKYIFKCFYFKSSVLRFKKNIYNLKKSQKGLIKKFTVFSKKINFFIKKKIKKLKKNKINKINKILYFVYRLKKYRKFFKKIKFYFKHSKIKKYLNINFNVKKKITL